MGKRIEKIEFSKDRKEVNLVKITPAEMGFESDYATTKEIYAKAKEIGLQLCPAEIGLYLRLDYDEDDWTVIGMEAIKNSDGDPSLLGLDRRDGGEWLNSDYDNPGDKWDRGVGFVFLAPQGFDFDSSSSALSLDLESAIKLLKDSGYKVSKEL